MAATPANRPRSPFFIIALVGVAIAALVILNVSANQFRPKTPQEMQREEAEKMKAEAEKQKKEGKTAETPAAPADPAATAAAAASANGLAGLGAEAAFGPAEATKEVVIGYEWTPQVQGNPSLVADAVAAIQKDVPQARVRVVNVDANPGTPAGVSVDGRVVFPAGADGGFNPGESAHAVQDALGLHNHGAEGGGGEKSLPSKGNVAPPAATAQ